VLGEELVLNVSQLRARTLGNFNILAVRVPPRIGSPYL
jgi:hypothetical protein